MKTIIFSAIMMATVLMSCNQDKKDTNTTVTEPTATTEHTAAGEPMMHADVDTMPMTMTEDKKVEATTATEKFSIQKIVEGYLSLKNALTKDDANAAAKAGKNLYASFNAVNTNAIDAKNKKTYFDIADDAKEHAEHIGDNAGKIDHQREHLAMLSKDVNDLIAIFGSTTKLYQVYCPMYNDNKGAIWISETKEIRNPYYGAGMLTCGSVKKTF